MFRTLDDLSIGCDNQPGLLGLSPHKSAASAARSAAEKVTDAAAHRSSSVLTYSNRFRVSEGKNVQDI